MINIRTLLYFSFVSLLLATLAFTPADACTCAFTNIQKAYFSPSNTRFVKAIPVKFSVEGIKTTYYLKVLKEYKACTKRHLVTVVAKKNPFFCGDIKLTIGVPYVLPLQQEYLAPISGCQFIRTFDRLTKEEKKFLSTRQICCGGRCKCANGVQPVACVKPPCLSAKPPCADAVKCVNNYCGSCLAEWFDKTGQQACTRHF